MILGLMELVFKLPSDQRVVPFKVSVRALVFACVRAIILFMFLCVRAFVRVTSNWGARLLNYLCMDYMYIIYYIYLLICTHTHNR